MAASGAAAEQTLRDAVAANKGEYLLAIDGSIPVKNGGVYSLTGGRSNVSMLAEIAADAKAVLAIGTCAAYGGIPKAYPNPTGAVGVEDLVSGKPVVNIPGCPAGAGGAKRRSGAFHQLRPPAGPRRPQASPRLFRHHDP